MGLFTNPLSHAGYPPRVTGTPTTQPSEVRAATAVEVAAGVLDYVYVSPATASSLDAGLFASPPVLGSVTPNVVNATALTTNGTASINSGTNSFVTTINGGTNTGALHLGNTTGNTAVTGSLTASTTLTATSGNITATSGNFVGIAAGDGLKFNSPATSGAASGPVVVNGRSGQATFTGVSIAGGADLLLTVTNSAVTASTTQVIYSLSGATLGAALCIESVVNSAGSSAVTVTNGTGATTSIANIVLNFLVLN
jgi:hypothetical protein